MIQTWFLLSMVAPFLWAIVTLIDTHFVDDKYEDEYDGTLISGVFQSLPWLLVLLGIVDFTFPGTEVAFLALIAGGMFILSFFLYFKSLFISNDGALMQILWNTSALIVPILAWLLIGEILTNMHYAGIGIAFIGGFLFNFDRKIRENGFSQIATLMAGAVVCMSLNMVLIKKANDLSGDFWSIFFLFSLGATVTALGILVIGKKNPLQKATRIIALSRKYWFVFVLAEGLSVMATMTSQKAISLAPAVSFVAVIESLVPVFIMIISIIIVFIFRNTRMLDVSPYRIQYASGWIKIIALIFISVGIYAVS